MHLLCFFVSSITMSNFSRLTPMPHIIQQKLWLLNKPFLPLQEAVGHIMQPEAQATGFHDKLDTQTDKQTDS